MSPDRLGPYRIGRQLGKGGMGSVYEAVDEQTGQRVAVKALSPQLAMDEGFRERFEAEIESLKKLQHEGIVRLYGYGEDGGVLFYSMELVDGASLEAELARGRRFDWRETLGVAIQVCRALKHAHDHGVVHRDVKPANILLTPENKIKIADFGIARLFGSNQLTTAGGVLGTADYMSPEQADGRPVTDRCDQYALGCVMYALLAGRPPFRAKTMPEMLQLQRFAEPEPVRRYAPQTPEQLEGLIRQLLSKDPAARFPNALVLSRHMEAMEKALARGPKVESPAEPTRPRPAVSEAATIDSADATLAADSDDEIPLAGDSVSLFNAPTLAEPEQSLPTGPAESVSSAAGSPSISIAPLKTTAAGATAPPPRTRFTTVDEDARLRAQTAPAEHWATVAQLATLIAAILGLGWLGWRLTRPASAEDLLAAITAAVEQDGPEGATQVDAQIQEFMDRFADDPVWSADPRTAEVRGYAEELELVRMEKRLAAGGRLSGRPAKSPVAQLYREASAQAAADPAAAVERFEALLALYPPHGDATPALSETDRRYLALAQRQLAKSRSAAEQQIAVLLPALKERLAAASHLETTAPREAAAIYRALAAVAADRPWAEEIARQAADRLKLLGE
jgi:serine/threonine-protein kinase